MITARRRICLVIGSRANWGRLKAVAEAIRAHPQLELQLVVGASALLDRYGCIDVIERDGWQIDERIYAVVEGDTPACMSRTMGLFATQISNTLERLKPDVVLIHGDRFEMLGVASAVAYQNIPLSHTEGGEHTGSIDDKVRHAITQLADIHFPVTVTAGKHITRLRPSCKHVYVVGSTALDAIADIDLTVVPDLISKHRGVGAAIDPTKPYLVALLHPNTCEYGESTEQAQTILEAVKATHLPCVWLWPNVDSGSDAISSVYRRFREADNDMTPFHFVKNMSPEDYARLLNNCVCLVGNTSSGIKEGAFMGVPYALIGNRQQGREVGRNVKRVGFDAEEINRTICEQVLHGKYKRDKRFGDGTAGKKIAEVLAGDGFGSNSVSGGFKGDSA